MRKTAKKAGELVFWVLAILFLVAMLVLLLRTMPGKDAEAGEIALYYGGEQLPAGESRVELTGGTRAVFEVRSQGSASPVYEVRIVPDENAEFHYAAGGQRLLWRGIPSFAALFGLETQDGSFSILPPASGDPETVLAALYPGVEIELYDEEIPEELYTLLVFDGNGKAVYTIDLCIKGGIWVDADPDHIYF